jgi:hypothetical protein
MGGVSLYLIEVLISGSLSPGPLCIKGGAILGKGFLRNPCLLFPRSEGLHPSCELLLPSEE